MVTIRNPTTLALSEVSMSLQTLHSSYTSPLHHCPRELSASIDPSSDSLFTDRSIWNIIWSCTATIFACTWISVHPNIPAPNDSAIRVFGRRLAIMFNLLIAPEMVIVWTTRQYIAASDIVKRHKDKGWTKTHAFFVIMGGFSLYENGVLLRTLELSELEKLHEEGKIDWPSITEAEIKDKSKGDFFSKGVVVLQTTWFVVQCIVRGTKKMVLTELEVVTLAFSTLTMTIYALWWNKPLDVQMSVPVHIKEGYSSSDIKSPISEEPKNDTNPGSNAPDGRDKDVVQGALEFVQPPEPSTLFSQNTHFETFPSMPEAKPVEADADVEAQNTSQRSQSTSPEPPADDSPVVRPYQDPSLSLPQQFRVYLKAKREELGLITSIVYVFAIRPFVIFFGAFYDMMFCTTLEGRRYRVPTFYSPAVEDDSLSIIFAILVALVFGGIHCIAWSFEFPTVIEKWAWRVSAVLVSGLPLSISFFSVITSSFSENASGLADTIDNIILVFLALSSLLYIIARGVLLVLPVIGLRALPAGAYIDVNWTAYLPHI